MWRAVSPRLFRALTKAPLWNTKLKCKKGIHLKFKLNTAIIIIIYIACSLFVTDEFKDSCTIKDQYWTFFGQLIYADTSPDVLFSDVQVFLYVETQLLDV